MRITPEVIETKQFKKGLKGYNVDEVEDFLNEIIEEHELLIDEISSLKKEKESLLTQINHYKSTEGELNETLLKAQETAKKIKENALREAKMMEAHSAGLNTRASDADKLRQIEYLEKKYLSLKKSYTQYKESIKKDLRKQLSILESDVD